MKYLILFLCGFLCSAQEIKVTYLDVEEITLEVNKTERDYFVKDLIPFSSSGDSMLKDGFMYYVKTIYILEDFLTKEKSKLKLYVTENGAKAFYYKTEL